MSPQTAPTLVGRVALVTGSSRGLGRAIAEKLAADGARLVIHHAGEDAQSAGEVLELLASQGRDAFVRPFDVADEGAVREGVEDSARRWDRLDILVNNAGICPFADFFELSAREWDRVQAVNARGVFLCSQAAARIMRQQSWGRIINVTSISAELATDPRQVAYCASKAAANMLTRSLALILAPCGITVNAVLPGTVPTSINREVLRDPSVADEIRRRTPLGRLGTPEDIARAVSFLASPEAGWMTGSFLTVDGGYKA